ncbi:MAG: gas vesicle protein GvpC [Plectolyngbya sp. WJT66-NPBG17]|jgi:gas vesicle GvpC-like protein|nr:gas vesicle protein GvpC [Plectolyngbya sp. WJT66-NPBG17]MBW4526053.1 gas vesicle protein GvpC [Phormidium tanganyikae FI6-MK23]
MAFKDSWQQQRQLRLEQVEQRRQAVSLLLQETQKQRQTKASQLRSDLSLFRETLSYDTSVRREKLQNYCETLHEQTQEFLAIVHAERESVSQQLSEDLHTFRSTLTETVNSLRQEIQADLQLLQLETRSQLEEAHQHRIKQRVRLARNLSIFVEKLRSDVAAFLTDTVLERQEKALQDKRDRKVEMDRLFAGFADFRSQLKQFRADLSRTVWGEGERQTAVSDSPAPEVPAAKPVIKKPASPGFRVVAPVKSVPAAKSDEGKIYEYIEVMQSVRLTEIESALSMTRIQAVEGLRSLIQQGKITQRDRLYLIYTPPNK